MSWIFRRPRSPQPQPVVGGGTTSTGETTVTNFWSGNSLGVDMIGERATTGFYYTEVAGSG